MTNSKRENICNVNSTLSSAGTNAYSINLTWRPCVIVHSMMMLILLHHMVSIITYRVSIIIYRVSIIIRRYTDHMKCAAAFIFFRF